MVIPFFPKPLPDELLYSVVARYHKRSANPSGAYTVKELFGKGKSVSFDFPRRLGFLSERLLQRDLTVNTELLMRNQTLLPLYEPFMMPERIVALKEAMIQSDQGIALRGIPGRNSIFESRKFLRFCDTCVKEDLETYGVAYWHRTHQVVGVEVCPLHRDWLMESTVLINTSIHRAHMVNPYPEMSGKTVRSSEKEVFFEWYVDLAENLHWLLNRQEHVVGIEHLQKSYLKKLYERGYATPTGIVRRTKLSQAFEEHYLDFLKQLDSEVQEEHSWLQRLFSQKQPRQVHPTRHLLFIRFLSEDPKKLLTEKEEDYQPFGAGPWKCFNRVGGHFEEAVIEECQINYCSARKRPIGTFVCKECGFTYTRGGPDTCNEDQSRIGRVKDYGHVWKEELHRLAILQKKSWRETAAILGVSPQKVALYVRKANSHNDEREFITKREQVRTRWLHALQSNPTWGIKKIRRRFYVEYYWLSQNDNAWLQEHVPAKLPKPVVKRFSVDWEKRDQEILEKAKQAVNDILHSNSKPTRVTCRAISLAIAYYNFKKDLPKMPMTRQFVEESIETPGDFLLRKRKESTQH